MTTVTEFDDEAAALDAEYRMEWALAWLLAALFWAVLLEAVALVWWAL